MCISLSRFLFSFFLSFLLSFFLSFLLSFFLSFLLSFSLPLSPWAVNGTIVRWQKRGYVVMRHVPVRSPRTKIKEEKKKKQKPKPEEKGRKEESYENLACTGGRINAKRPGP